MIEQRSRRSRVDRWLARPILTRVALWVVIGYGLIVIIYANTL